MIRLMHLFLNRAIVIRGITILMAVLSMPSSSTLYAAEKLAPAGGKQEPEIFVQTGHHSVVSALTISPDGRFLAAADESLDTHNIKIWEISSGREYRTLFVKSPEQIRWVRFSADVKQIFIVAVTKIDVFDVGSGAHLETIDIGHIRNIRDVFAIDVDRLLSDLGLHAAHQNSLGMLQPKARTLVARDFVYSLTRKEQGKDDFVFDIKRTSDHRRVQQIELDNLSHFVLVGEVVVVTPDFRYLVAADKTNFKSTIKIWDFQTGRITKELGKVKPARFSWLAFSLNRRFLFNFDGLRVTPENQYGDAIGEPELNRSMGNRKVWDIESGRLLYSFGKGETPPDEYQSFFKENFFDKKNQKIYVRWGVQGSLDKKYAAVADWRDAIIRLVEQKTNKEIAQFITFNDGEWIVITPEGYFNASVNGAKYLNVRIGNNVYGIDQFYSRFYRPELVSLALAGKDIPQGELITDIASQKPAPKIQIISPATGSTVNRDSITMTLKITDNGGGIGAVNVYLNGAQVANETRSVIVKGKTSANEKILTFTIPLIEGQNEIRAVAFNKENSMESNPALVSIVSNAVHQKPNLYALVIGINTYKNKSIALTYAVPDAIAFGETLQKSAAPLFEKTDVQVLTAPEDTTKEAIVKAFTGLRLKIKPNDLFVFYDASHGIVDVVNNEEQYFLLTSNVLLLSSRSIGKDALSQKELAGLIGNIPAQKKLVILDTCSAGKGGKEIQIALLQQTRGLNEATAVKLLQRTIGSVVFSASSDTQQALEGYKGHGLFTYVLMEGLRGKADLKKDGFITIYGLADYVGEQVVSLSEEVFKRQQTPIVETSSSTNFPIGRIK